MKKYKTFAFICIIVCSSIMSFSQSEKKYFGKKYKYSLIVNSAIWLEANETKLTAKMLQDTRLAKKLMFYEYLFTTDTLSTATLPFFTIMVLPTQENVYPFFKAEYNKQFLNKIVKDNNELFENYVTNIELGGVSFNDEKQTITSFIPISRTDGINLINMMHIICDDNKFAQITFASTQKQFTELKSEYQNIANSFIWDEQAEIKISLQNVASFIVPSDLEIQSGFLQDIAKKVYNEYGIEYQEDEIVLQQNGLNSFKQQAFNTYFRIILKPIHDKTGLYAIDFNKADIETTNNAYMQIAKKSLTSNTKFLKQFSPKTVYIDGISCFLFSYERQLNNNLPVTVNHYVIQKNDKLISLMISYRTAEKNNWINTINEFIKSIEIK